MAILRCLFFIGNMVLICLVAGFFKWLIMENCVGNYLTDQNAFLSLVYVRNNGAAFNLFAGFEEILIFFAAVIIFICILYTLLYKLYISDKFLLLLSLFCAGVLGNAYERYSFGYVTDFIKINFLNFPVFNIYDIFITTGAILITVIILYDKKKEAEEIRNAEEDDMYRDIFTP